MKSLKKRLEKVEAVEGINKPSVHIKFVYVLSPSKRKKIARESPHFIYKGEEEINGKIWDIWENPNDKGIRVP